MLNDLYTCFDRVLDVHDVYKVSSLPYFHVCDRLLYAIVKAVKSFCICI